MWVAHDQAITLITSPKEHRRPIERTPADLGLPYTDVEVTAADGIRLAGRSSSGGSLDSSSNTCWLRSRRASRRRNPVCILRA